jgi:hypothetical protein
VGAVQSEPVSGCVIPVSWEKTGIASHLGLPAPALSLKSSWSQYLASQFPAIQNREPGPRIREDAALLTAELAPWRRNTSLSSPDSKRSEATSAQECATGGRMAGACIR